MARKAGEATQERSRIRKCALTHQRKSADKLIRFVATPQGEVVPDLAAKLPGRGVWIDAKFEIVARAVANRAFGRSLKGSVKASDNLPEIVSGQLRRRALEALSIAKKAGLIVSGYSKVEAAIDKADFVALIHALDGSSDGRKKLDKRLLRRDEESGKERPPIDTFTRLELSLALGQPNVVHAGLSKGGAGSKFLRATQILERYTASAGYGPTA